MSELTERSKCVFQAKLAEQAERYDGRFRKPKRVLVFTKAMIGFAIQSVFEGEFCVCLLFQFVANRRRVAKRGPIVSRPNDRADRCIYASSTLFHFIFLRDAPRNDRGFEETVRDSGHRVDGT